MVWRLAKSLETLRSQINAAAPKRSKVSDGTIGDEKHSHTKSDHNPDRDGVVKALDITHDPANGADCNVLAESLVASRDRRIQYIIWNRRICNSEVQPWVWRPYTGSNPHNKHIHISVQESPALYDDMSPWGFQLGNTAAVQPPPPRPAPTQRPVPRPAPAPSLSQARPIPDPTDALVEPDTRSGWQKFLDAIAEFFAGLGKRSGR